jgi:ubiquinone/menaquinone biosynthesis C-methylase UbiE
MTIDELMEMARGAWNARILLTAVELGIPDALEAKAMTAAETAAALGTDPRATALLLNALAALGLATKSGDRFANAPVAKAALVKGARDGRAAALRHHAHLWRSWSALTDVVRTGHPAAGERERPPEEYHDFVRAMHDLGWERAQTLAATLDLAGTRRLLDLGGGPGSYAVAFCARYPALQAVIFDRAPALDVAREIVRANGLERQVGFQAGDFLADDIGSGYDLALVSQVLHAYDEDRNRLLLRKVARALVPGGRVVVQEFFLNESRAAPAPSAVFAINMLVNTGNGRTYTWDEVEAWLVAAGFTRVRRMLLNGPAGVLVAGRP